MRFVGIRHEHLPRLAWCARLGKGSSDIQVHHGPWVELGDEFLVEGAWAGRFQDGLLDENDALMGTGARLRSGKAVFATSSHPLQRLHLVKTDDAVFVSPSLAFCLSLSGNALDPTHIPYQTDLQKLVRNIDCHIGSIPMKSGRAMQIVHYRNIAIGPDLSVDILPKPNPPRWREFKEYEQFLLGRLAALVENANDPARRVHYGLVSSLSSGYDSSAVTALAAEVGCQEAICFKSARPEVNRQDDLDDTGTAVANALGIRLRLYDRLAYKSLRPFPEAEFMASGELGQEVYLAAAEEQIAGKMLITGDHGDRVWDRLAKRVKRNLPRKGSAGCSLTEFRLRAGVIHLPLALIGAINHPELKAITVSAEMKPWTLNTRYDRPIARRFVEERGVPRGSFAQQKRAVSVLLNSDERIRGQLSDESLADFLRFYEAHRKLRDPAEQRHFERRHQLFLGYRRLLRYAPVDRVLDAVGLRSDLLCPVAREFRENPGPPSFLVHWGLQTIMPRYSLSPRAPEDRSTAEAARVLVG